MLKCLFLTALLLSVMGSPQVAVGQEPEAPPYPESLVQYPNGGPFSLDPNCTAYLRVILRVMRDGQGQGGVTQSQALDALAYLNQTFSAYNIVFQHANPQDQVRFHDDQQYYPMDIDDCWLVTTDHTEFGAINIYFVDGVSGQDWTGFTPTTSAYDLFIRSEHRTSSHIIHEMGHILGLWHTHGIATSAAELVTRGSGANCTTAGDMLCDTPAEPYNNKNGIRNYVSSSTCTYSGTFQDANNEYYTPDTRNYMGYSHPDCRNSFTAQQIAVMRSYIANDQYGRFGTLVGRTVHFANIVSGSEFHNGEIRIDRSDGTQLHVGTSPYDYDLGTCITYGVETLSERLQSPTSVYEKHQSWNEDYTTFKLRKDFVVTQSQQDLNEKAWFHTMTPITLTVQSDGGTLAPEILFKDPWFLESNDTQLDQFNPFAAPHTPTGAMNESTGGVFEHINNPDFPKYLYQAHRYLDANLTDKQLPLDVGDWVCTGMRATNPAAAEVLESSDYPDLTYTHFNPTLTRIVQVNQDNAELQADYKAHRCSVNNERPSAGNSQRRIVYDDRDETLLMEDRHYAVYESGGRIYVITSEDAGVSWSPEVPISASAVNCKYPAIAILDDGNANGILYVVYVDLNNSEVVFTKRDSWTTLSWTEFDRIGITDPEQCHPSIAALMLPGYVRAVSAVWEDVGVVIPPSQTPTNVLKMSIYEDETRKIGTYRFGGQYNYNVEFRDMVFAEGEFDWRRRKPQYPAIIMKESYPRFGISWRDDRFRLYYDDITRDPQSPSILVNNGPIEQLPVTGFQVKGAASLCVFQPSTGAPALAYEAQSSWTNWPSPTISSVWPLMLGSRQFNAVTTIYPQWPPIPDPVSVGDPSRVYVRLRSGMDDYPAYRGNAWSTVARVLSYRNPDQVVTSPSIGAEGSGIYAKLRVAVNDGAGGLSVANLDALPAVTNQHMMDGYDPNVTVRGELQELYSQPRHGDPFGLKHSLFSGNYGLTKATSTIEQFMREVTVMQDSSFAVYGICMPQLMLNDSTRFELEWEHTSLDTIAVTKDAHLSEIVRTSAFGVSEGARIEYATELFAQYADRFDSQFDFRIEFVDTETEEVLLMEDLNVSLLPSDSAWYVLYQIDISSLAGETVYMRMDISDTSSVYLLDVADIYDVQGELGKTAIEAPTSAHPQSITLYQNYPNPFNPSTTIAFNLAEAGPVTLNVYDIFGRLVQTILSKEMTAGAHSVVYTPASEVSGVYLYQLVAGGTRKTGRMVMLK